MSRKSIVRSITTQITLGKSQKKEGTNLNENERTKHLFVPREQENFILYDALRFSGDGRRGLSDDADVQQREHGRCPTVESGGRRAQQRRASHRANDQLRAEQPNE